MALDVVLSYESRMSAGIIFIFLWLLRLRFGRKAADFEEGAMGILEAGGFWEA